MIEHEIWKGCCFEQGIEGKKIFIIGNSHHLGNGENDVATLTRDVVARWIKGESLKTRFFRQIQEAFGESTATFWNKVVFFNFVPEAIGTSDQKHEKASESQIESGRKRFLEALGLYQPDLVLVFSNDEGKGWRVLPKTDEELIDPKSLKRFEGENFPDHVEWGTYNVLGKEVKAVGARHPLGAPGGLLARIVKASLKL